MLNRKAALGAYDAHWRQAGEPDGAPRIGRQTTQARSPENLRLMLSVLAEAADASKPGASRSRIGSRPRFSAQELAAALSTRAPGSGANFPSANSDEGPRFNRAPDAEDTPEMLDGILPSIANDPWRRGPVRLLPLVPSKTAVPAENLNQRLPNTASGPAGPAWRWTRPLAAAPPPRSAMGPRAFSGPADSRKTSPLTHGAPRPASQTGPAQHLRTAPAPSAAKTARNAGSVASRFKPAAMPFYASPFEQTGAATNYRGGSDRPDASFQPIAYGNERRADPEQLPNFTVERARRAEGSLREGDRRDGFAVLYGPGLYQVEFVPRRTVEFQLGPVRGSVAGGAGEHRQYVYVPADGGRARILSAGPHPRTGRLVVYDGEFASNRYHYFDDNTREMDVYRLDTEGLDLDASWQRMEDHGRRITGAGLKYDFMRLNSNSVFRTLADLEGLRVSDLGGGFGFENRLEDDLAAVGRQRGGQRQDPRRGIPDSQLMRRRGGPPL